MNIPFLASFEGLELGPFHLDLSEVLQRKVVHDICVVVFTKIMLSLKIRWLQPKVHRRKKSVDFACDFPRITYLFLVV